MQFDVFKKDDPAYEIISHKTWNCLFPLSFCVDGCGSG